MQDFKEKIKDKVINIIVSIVMAVIALYPMYKDLKSTVDEVNVVIKQTNETIYSVQSEITDFQKDIDDLSSQVDSAKGELQLIINNGLSRTENIINKELDSLNVRISNIKTNAIEDVKSKTLDILPNIKF